MEKITLGDTHSDLHHLKSVLVNESKGEKMKSIGAMWSRKDKNGEEYFTMALGENSYVLFKNNRKKEDRHPDFYVFLRGKAKVYPTKES